MHNRSPSWNALASSPWRAPRTTASSSCMPSAHEASRSSPFFESRRRRIFACSRSEEHTSELQSLMRISYAVFCLKKKKKKEKHKNDTQLHSSNELDQHQ